MLTDNGEESFQAETQSSGLHRLTVVKSLVVGYFRFG